MRSLVLLVLILSLPWAVSAQATPPQTVTVTASDGLTLVGDFYRPAQTDSGPAVLLLHMLNSRRQSWEEVIPTLLARGVSVLAVDMRGHGATGGAQEWTLAEADVQVWLEWLKTQPGIEGLAIMGASIGSNLALRATANDPDVLTVVALSPGLNYRNVTTEEAVLAIGERPVLLVAARRDNPSGADTAALFDLTQGEAQIRLFTDSSHGSNMFGPHPSLLEVVADWLAEHTLPAST